jgi:hypothetical protein
MAWTAEVVKKAWDKGVVVLTVRYTDGAQVHEELLRRGEAPEVGWVDAQIKARLEA